MGDRANIIVKQGHDLPPVVLYTHWGGSRAPEMLRTALAKKLRWNDPAYLTRIIFDVMTDGEHGEETGFGISTGLPDNEHALLVVDTDTRTVSIYGYAWREEGGIAAMMAKPPVREFTFEAYVALGDTTWDGLGMEDED